MLKSYEIIDKINTVLSSYKEIEHIVDFRIILNMNMAIDIFIKIKDEQNIDLTNLYEIIAKYKSVHVQIINQDQIDFEDNDYSILFDKITPLINYGFRKRFDGFFDTSTISLKSKVNCPVVTFYSYKGGMGRTTTLIAYAIHCVLNLNKKVVILDCDFEAPGYYNFFKLRKDEPQNGIVEFLLDKKFDGNINVKDYCFDLESYPNLKIMPAGDLTQVSKVRNYIDALSKLDYAKTTVIVKEFNNLLLSIEKEIEPDLILIDSRTGFSDIFDFTALKLSNLIIGFFGSSDQTGPGREFLLQQFVQNRIKHPDRNINLVLINSILPVEQDKANFYHSKFISDVDTEFRGILAELEIEENSIDVPKRPLRRNEFAEEIGIVENANDNFTKLIRLIKERKEQIIKEELTAFGLDTNKPSEKISEQMSNLKEASYDYEEIFNVITDTLQLDQEEIHFEMGDDITVLKKELLNYINSALPRDEKSGALKLFEDNSIPKPSRFFYREFMRYIFDKDKFIISGFKGTGKTLLFNVLSNVDKESHKLRKQLITNASIKDKDPNNFIFLKVTDFSKDDKLFQILVEDEQIHNGLNFSRFWVIYLWTKLVTNSFINSEIKQNYQDLISNSVSSTKAIKFAEIANDILQYSKIEEDLIKIDDWLTKNQKTVFVLFDQLDNLVKAEFWGNVISPLIMYWWNNNFNSIYPKIFVRTDLFATIRGTNTLRIKNEMVNIEWTRDEVYAYFLKLVLSSDQRSKPIFIKIMREYLKNEIDIELFKEIENNLKTNENNQIPLHRRFTEPIINTFFGHEKVGNGLKPYDFFYLNLSNANGTLSLRPFINWLAYILAKTLDNDDKESYPIIPGKYFNDQSLRDLVAEDHFYDLTNEDFNKDLHSIPVFIRTFKVPSHLQKKYRQKIVWENHLLEFLRKMINEIKNNGIYIPRLKETRNKVSNTPEQILSLMLDCGIIKEIGTSYGKKYEYATMYHYWLQLSGKGLSSPDELIQSSVEYRGLIVQKNENGFGWIKIDEYSGNNIFFHFSKLRDFTFDEVIPGKTRVIFGYGVQSFRDPSKLGAVNIRLLK